MKKLFSISLATLLIANVAISQEHKKPAPKTSKEFEGQIDFMQYNGVDTTYYTYYVKGRHIRVDNIDPKTSNIEGSYLIDLSTKKTTALSPIRKVYFDQPSPAPVKPEGTTSVTKTKNTKKISGYTCTEYIVEDKEEGLKISYWMASGHFDFFLDMMKVLNRKDKFSEYYLAIPHAEGMFPMLALETDLSGATKGEMKATKVKEANVMDGTFGIPPGYKEFKK